MRCGEQSIEVGQFAEYRIYGRVIRNIVAEIRHRRAEDRREPERIDAKLRKMRQPADDACKVADAVALAVLKRPRIDLVDDGGLPPRRIHGSTADLDDDAFVWPQQHRSLNGGFVAIK